jgi:hypothetical protein
VCLKYSATGDLPHNRILETKVAHNACYVKKHMCANHFLYNVNKRESQDIVQGLGCV